MAGVIACGYFKKHFQRHMPNWFLAHVPRDESGSPLADKRNLDLGRKS